VLRWSSMSACEQRPDRGAPVSVLGRWWPAASAARSHFGGDLRRPRPGRPARRTPVTQPGRAASMAGAERAGVILGRAGQRQPSSGWSSRWTSTPISANQPRAPSTAPVPPSSSHTIQPVSSLNVGPADVGQARRSGGRAQPRTGWRTRSGGKVRRTRTPVTGPILTTGPASGERIRVERR
jgi:hypothetical protein